VLSLLAARDVLALTSTCHALSGSSTSVKLALERVLTRRFADVASFLRASESHWPRSLAVLRGAEMLRIKELLSRSAAYSFEDAAQCAPSCVVVSRAWLGAYRKRCQAFEQFLQQFRRTKRQQRLQNAKKRDVRAVEPLKMVPNASLRQAGHMIVCAHDALLPAAQCVGRSRRAIVSGEVFRELSVYAPELRGFALRSCCDCSNCVLEQEARELEAEERKKARFDAEIAGSENMLELLERKHGFPKGLFSPAEAASNRQQQLAPHLSVNGRSKFATYFLVPKKWLTKWRKYVRSQGDEAPGPVLNAELVCLSHQRTIVPPYISMFLSGFTLEQSLKATQA
jgi:hypothetical protein